MRPLFCLVLLLAHAPALSQAARRGSPSETRIHLYGGKSFTRDTYLTLSQPGKNTRLTFEGVSYGDESFEMPPYYGIRVVHFPGWSPNLGLAVDFVHFKVYANERGVVRAHGTENGLPVDRFQVLGDTISRFSISHGVNYLTLNLLGRLSLLAGDSYPAGRLQPYGGVGFGPTILHPESRIGGVARQQYEWDAWSWQIFFGAEFLVTPEASVFFEFKHTNQTFTVDVPGGTAQTRISADHLVFGVGWRY
jgi:hypothetical protein